MKDVKLLGVRLCDRTEEELRGKFSSAFTGQKCLHVTTVNPEFLVCARGDLAFREILNGSYAVVDGVGICLVSRLLYGAQIRRIPGVRVAEIVAQEAAKTGARVALLGGFNVAKRAAEKLKDAVPEVEICYAEDGDKNTLEDALVAAKPAVLLVAYGAPAQEKWIAKYAAKIPSLRVVVGVGGTLDFWSGRTTRAPRWLRKLGLEWLFRLLKEPWRARRIFTAVVVFPVMALWERLKR